MEADTNSKQTLKEARHGLLKLHKILLDQEKVNYEMTWGKIGSVGEYLNLVMHDSWFAWLRSMSQLIVEIDEAFDADEPVTGEIVNTLAGQIRELLASGDETKEFTIKYQAALQQSETAILEHAEIMKRVNLLLA